MPDHISSEPIVLRDVLISGLRCGNGIIMLNGISFLSLAAAVQISMPTEVSISKIFWFLTSWFGATSLTI